MLTQRITPSFNHSRVFHSPFDHAWIPRLFCEQDADAALAWLAEDLPWEHTRESFYEQHEFSLSDVAPPEKVSFLTAQTTLSPMRSWFRETFGRDLTERVEVVAHRLVPEQKIGIHNDYLPNGETHRLTFQLGRGVEGGITMLFETPNPDSVRRLVRPIHGTAFAFRISNKSYHAVSRVTAGARYTLVYSFYADR